MPKRRASRGAAQTTQTRRRRRRRLLPAVDCDALPNEMIAHVLVHVERRGSDRLHALLVCQRWLRIGRAVYDPSEDDNFALRQAALYRRPEQVRALLADRRVDPSVGRNAPLECCIEFGGDDDASLVAQFVEHPRFSFCNWEHLIMVTVQRRLFRMLFYMLLKRNTNAFRSPWRHCRCWECADFWAHRGRDVEDMEFFLWLNAFKTAWSCHFQLAESVMQADFADSATLRAVLRTVLIMKAGLGYPCPFIT